MKRLNDIRLENEDLGRSPYWAGLSQAGSVTRTWLGADTGLEIPSACHPVRARFYVCLPNYGTYLDTLHLILNERKGNA